MDQEKNNQDAAKQGDAQQNPAPLSLETENKPAPETVVQQQPQAQQAPTAPVPPVQQPSGVPQAPTTVTPPTAPVVPKTPAAPVAAQTPPKRTEQVSPKTQIPLAPPLNEAAKPQTPSSAPLSPPQGVNVENIEPMSGPADVKDEDSGNVMSPPQANHGLKSQMKKPLDSKKALLGGVAIVAGLAIGGFLMFGSDDGTSGMSKTNQGTSAGIEQKGDWLESSPPQPNPIISSPEGSVASAPMVDDLIAEPEITDLPAVEELATTLPDMAVNPDLAELHQEALGAQSGELDMSPPPELIDEEMPQLTEAGEATVTMTDANLVVPDEMPLEAAKATEATDPKLAALIEEPSEAELALVNNAATLMQMSEEEGQKPLSAITPAPSSQSVEDLINALDAEAAVPMQGQQIQQESAVTDQSPSATGMAAVVRPLPKKFLILKKSARSKTKDAKVFAAQRAMNEGRYQAAYEMFDRLGEKYKKDKRVLMGKALSLQKIGNTERAIEAYEHVLTHHPKNIDAFTNMLGLLRKQEPGLALEKLIELYEIYPSNEAVLAQLGSTYGYLGRYEEGVRYLDIAITLDRDNISYLYNRAVLLDHLGRRVEAVGAYQMILNMASRTEKFKGTIPLDSIRMRLRDIQ